MMEQDAKDLAPFIKREVKRMILEHPNEESILIHKDWLGCILRKALARIAVDEQQDKKPSPARYRDHHDSIGE